MPWLVFEKETGPRIADEFEKLARVLRSWPPGESAGARGPEASRTILQSLQTINAAFAEGAKKGTVDAASFGVIGREFQKIGTTVSQLGGGTKT